MATTSFFTSLVCINVLFLLPSPSAGSGAALAFTSRDILPFYTCAPAQSCLKHSHADFCCPPQHTCHSSSTLYCCPLNIRCAHGETMCPQYTFPCATRNEKGGGGCCPLGFLCGAKGCEEREYKTLAVPDEVWSFYPLVSSTKMMEKEEGGTVVGMSVSQAVVTSLGVRDGVEGGNGGNLPISERVLGTPTAFAAKIAKVPRVSGACGRKWKRVMMLLVAGVVWVA